jgi:hypothetical protein
MNISTVGIEEIRRPSQARNLGRAAPDGDGSVQVHMDPSKDPSLKIGTAKVFAEKVELAKAQPHLICQWRLANSASGFCKSVVIPSTTQHLL